MKKNMFRAATHLALACVVSACVQTTDPLRQRLLRLDAIVDPYIKDEKIAGFVGLVLHDGKVVYERAAGWTDRETKKPMRTDTIFRIASLTKAMTTVAALMLVEEGKLKLDEPLGKYVSSFYYVKVALKDETIPPDPVTKKNTMKLERPHRQVTIQQLLSHTSGISYGMHRDLQDDFRKANLGIGGLPAWYLSGSPDTICRTAYKLGKTPLVTHPGNAWVYGYSTDILGCVIEKVSGMKLDEFFQKRILDKLGMKDTYFYLPPEKQDRLAVLYGSNGGGKVSRSPYQGGYVKGPRVNFSGGAGLVSTAADYVLFVEMIRNGGKLGDVQLLKPESVKLMTTNQVGESYGAKGYGFSYGFETVDRPNEVSYGWFGAYGPYLRVYPKEKIVMLQMTQLFPNGADMREKIIAELQNAMAEKNQAMPLARR
jgi:CubicO group peptidase (beta-lactamase class C family)